MAESNVVKTKRDGTISFADNSGFGGANTYTVSKEIGDFSITAPKEAKTDFLDRGRLVSCVRFGDDQPLTGSFTLYFRDATDAATETMMDILNNSGHVGSTWVSTLGASAEVFAVDLRYTIEGTDHGDGADHTIDITDVSFDYSIAEGDPTTITVNWQSHADVRPTLA